MSGYLCFPSNLKDINNHKVFFFPKKTSIYKYPFPFTVAFCNSSSSHFRTKYRVHVWSLVNPIWNRGGCKNAPPLVFFFKYLQNKKRYDFALLWILVIIYFERFCQISRKNFDWFTSYCDFVKGVPKNFKKNFFQFFFFFFFWNNFFCKIFQVYIMLKW